jgi:crotonobetainyl-CoA:carnitine CoA-transferase CaiB-like acyl-CoA transferase
LAPITLPDGERAGQTAATALLPLSMGGERLGVRCDPPRLGQDSLELLVSLGYSQAEAERLSVANGSKNS